MIVSVIIALYNTEKYIEKCINSIYNKDNFAPHEFEVIVINDGSTDRGPEIVRELQRDHTNLILIDKVNGGQSSARNIGFRVAKGKYIFCLDSDDYIDSTELRKALEICQEKNLDLLPIYLSKYDENDNKIQSSVDRYQNMSSEVITGAMFLANFVIYGSMCRYIYRTSLIKKNEMKLIEGIFHEDEDFVIKYISYSKRVAYAKNYVYKQLVRPSSTVNNKNKAHRLKLLNDLLIVLGSLSEHRKHFPPSSLEFTGISKKMEQIVITIFVRMKRDGMTQKETIPYISTLKNLQLFPIRVNHLTLRFRIVAFLFNIETVRKFYYK